MRIINKLLDILTGKKLDSNEHLIEAEVCPNCWGKQEYANEYKEIIKERARNANEQKAFVEKFIETHLTGVRLKQKFDKLVCETCSGVFIKSSTNAN